ncbi:MAG TPA: SPFH domain-containing protein [Nannocystis sp.]|jgi:uncharacterized membrane protein YqiK
MDPTIILTVTVAVTALVLGLNFAMIARWYRRVPANAVLVVTSQQGVRVLRRGGVVLPIIHGAESLDLGPRTIDIRRVGREGIVCRDNIRVDVTATFTLAVRDSVEDITKIARSIGCAGASDPEVLRKLFTVRLEDAVREVLRNHDYAKILSLRSELRDQILDNLGEAIDGFELKAVALGPLEPTPVDQLDRENIIDAEGIRRMTEIVCAAGIATSELQQRLKTVLASA